MKERKPLSTLSPPIPMYPPAHERTHSHTHTGSHTRDSGPWENLLQGAGCRPAFFLNLIKHRCFSRKASGLHAACGSLASLWLGCDSYRVTHMWC